MSSILKIGIIGLDSSHMVYFSELLNGDDSYGARVSCAFPGGSSKFHLSINRLDDFTRRVRETGASIVSDINEMHDDLDAIIIGSVDARQHLEQFQAIATRRIPVFINKPLATSYMDAIHICRLADQWHSPVLSASGMRFAQSLVNVLEHVDASRITGTDLYFPMGLVNELPGYFWYGIHGIEMAYRIMGSGCFQLCGTTNDHSDILTAQWDDGRYVTLRGQRTGNNAFGGMVHLPDRSFHFQVSEIDKPYYVSQLEVIIQFFRTGISPIPVEQTLEIVRCIEAANTSRGNPSTASSGFIRLDKIEA